MNRTLVFAIGISLFLNTAQIVYAQEYGVIMETSGDVVIQRDSKKILPNLGVSVSVGDTIFLAENSTITLVSISDCNEWSVSGPDDISISPGSGINSKKSKLTPIRELPVCYKPSEFKVMKSGSLGGYVLREGQEDQVSGLRDEFKAGKASVSTLITLVIHDLKNGDKDRARPYFKELLRKSPDSGFVKAIGKIFTK